VQGVVVALHRHLQPGADGRELVESAGEGNYRKADRGTPSGRQFPSAGTMAQWPAKVVAGKMARASVRIAGARSLALTRRPGTCGCPEDNRAGVSGNRSTRGFGLRQDGVDPAWAHWV
jgi:hypothetical protein